MNIVMLTNTFAPHVGGVARSVQAFAGEFRRLGHRVMVVAPTFEGMPQDETDVIRIPAIEHLVRVGRAYRFRAGPAPLASFPFAKEHHESIAHGSDADDLGCAARARPAGRRGAAAGALGDRRGDR